MVHLILLLKKLKCTSIRLLPKYGKFCMLTAVQNYYCTLSVRKCILIQNNSKWSRVFSQFQCIMLCCIVVNRTNSVHEHISNTQCTTAWQHADMERLPSRPYFVEHFHEAIIQHERDCNIQAYTTQSRNCTFVKPATQYLQLACKGLVVHSLIISQTGMYLHNAINCVKVPIQ
jgi:hypothetical protein